MTEPLALFLYEKLLPSGQLVNRLQDMGYRVQTLSDPTGLTEAAVQSKPLLILTDLEPNPERICEAISKLRSNSETSHVPVIAFVSGRGGGIESSARAAGATLVVNDTAILTHLEHFLDQALQLD